MQPGSFASEKTTLVQQYAHSISLEGKDEYVDVNIALSPRALTLDLIGDIPYILLINEAELTAVWEVTEKRIARLEAQGLPVLKTSAKTGLAVEEAFALL